MGSWASLTLLRIFGGTTLCTPAGITTSMTREAFYFMFAASCNDSQVNFRTAKPLQPQTERHVLTHEDFICFVRFQHDRNGRNGSGNDEMSNDERNPARGLGSHRLQAGNLMRSFCCAGNLAVHGQEEIR